MTGTSASLLYRISHRPTERDWRRFVDIYGPLLLNWLRQYGVQHSDACDISQQVLEVVVREIPTFQYDAEKGSFRAWLRKVMINRLRTFWRDRKKSPHGVGSDELQQQLSELEDPSSNLICAWNLEYESQVARRILRLIRDEFEEKTWQAFWQIVVDGLKPAEVASNLGATINAVYLAKFRVLRRLKEEGEGLLE